MRENSSYKPVGGTTQNARFSKSAILYMIHFLRAINYLNAAVPSWMLEYFPFPC